ncbi:MAG: HD domain-containing protein [Phycisphaerae bacterium]|nr:HD domain-containing protein [Phycisphaerae bacterium]
MSVVEIDNNTPLAECGFSGCAQPSVRAGFLPVPLQHMPLSVLNTVPVYVKARTTGNRNAVFADTYSLYTAGVVPLSEADRERLISNGIRFVYVRIADQRRLQRALESCLASVAGDPEVPVSEASALVYETSFGLMNEVLSDPTLRTAADPLRHVCEAISTLVVCHQNAFSHLFAAARHDFFTATHLVNVATWIVPLAYQLGCKDEAELIQIGQAGLLHDLGKVRVSSEIINKEGELTDEERGEIRRHPEIGHELLATADWCSELVATVALQHHEHMDGSGYPHQLKSDAIHFVSRMCAVADAFDAMTAVRPYKDRALSAAEAMAILQSETPDKFDPRVMAAWFRLMVPNGAAREEKDTSARERREYPRFRFRCPAVVRILSSDAQTPCERPEFEATTHNLSRGGIGLYHACPLPLGCRVRVYPQVRAWTREYLEGTVVRCRETSEGSYDIGVEFTPECKALTRRRAGADDR